MKATKKSARRRPYCANGTRWGRTTCPSRRNRFSGRELTGISTSRMTCLRPCKEFCGGDRNSPRPAAAAFEGLVRREPYPVAEKVHEILTGLAARCDTVPGAVPPQQEPVRGRRDLSGGAGAVPAEADLSGRRGSGLHGGPNWGANAKESGREVPRAGRTGQKEW